MTFRFNEIGRIGRARGLDGWVRFFPDKNVPEDFFSESAIVYIKNDRAGFQPLRVEDQYTEQKKNQLSFFVKFDMITDRTSADAVKDKALFSDQFDPEKELEVDTSESVLDVTGYEIQTGSIVIGNVLDLIQNPAHYILEVKTDNGVLLIPYVDEYVIRTNHENRVINCQNLDQLTDD